MFDRLGQLTAFDRSNKYDRTIVPCSLISNFFIVAKD